MPRITSEDVVSVSEFFKGLEDPRSSINRKHLLCDLIVICVCGVLAGEDGPRAIGVWAKSNCNWLRQHLQLPAGIPSHDTIGRLLALLKPAAFQSCFENWIRSLRDRGGEDEVIAIDGKALRRSHDRKKGLGALFLVSAWSAEQGISLGQLATEEKSNEITAIPELSDNIDVAGAIVTIDAAGCQKHIAERIMGPQQNSWVQSWYVSRRGRDVKAAQGEKELTSVFLPWDFSHWAKLEAVVGREGSADHKTGATLRPWP